MMRSIAFFALGIFVGVGMQIGPSFADQTRIKNYNTARDVFVYDQVYPSGGRTLYCDRPFTGRSGLQVEHVLPASWMKEAGGCSGKSRKQCRKTSTRFNHMEADLHNLWPALADANQDRSNFRFGVIGQDSVDKWQGFCDFEIDPGNRLVEPRPSIRGDIARMVLYMVREYDIELPEGQHTRMIEWHCKDNAPSAEEVRRNHVIASLQDTRNPFIDNPSLHCSGDGSAGSDQPSDDVWADCRIKGNIGRGGAKIYHVPGSRSYKATKINTAKGERWFCSVAEAESAGWRAPR